jgi:Flp pilus assembly protein TadD
MQNQQRTVKSMSSSSSRKFWCVAVAALAILLSAGGCQNGKAKDKKEATARWNRARAGVMLSLANDQFKAGNLEQCRKTVDGALKLDPQNPSLHILSAKLCIEQGQLEMAERELEEARRAAPNAAEAYYLSGVVYQRWQKPQMAYEFYTAAADKAPAELAYVTARAEMLVELGRSNEALSLLQEKVNYFENSPVIRDAYGQLLMQAGRYGDAVDMFRQASVLAEDDLTLRERFALALYYDKQYVEAAEVLAKLLENDGFKDRADLLAALGQAQLQTGKHRDARRSFEAATQRDPSNVKTWLGLGRAAMEANDFKRAELALRKAHSLDKDAAEPYLLHGYLRIKQNRMKDALASFQKASTLDPQDTVSVCMVGYVYEKTGKHDLAMQQYGKALKMKPNDRLASQLMAGIDLQD